MQRLIYLLSLIFVIGCSGQELDPSPTDDDQADNVGGALGRFKMTLYWVAEEKNFSAGGEREIFDKQGCTPIAEVSLSFRKALDLEGSGRLNDGRVVTFGGSCSCPRSPCYSVTDTPFGLGARSNPLDAYRSIAVDTSEIRLGRHLFVPDLNGVEMPGTHGFVHDGCVRADDVGGAIDGRHIDFFIPTVDHFHDVLGKTPPAVEIFDGGERCADFESVRRFVGEPCTADEQCGFEGGFCLPDPDVPGGYCTRVCTGSCPDSPGSPTTRCVAAPAHVGSQMDVCAIECDDGCRDGLTCQSLGSPAGADRDVCF